MDYDEIITEVWKNRDDYAASHHYDLKEIVADLKNRQRNPHTQIVDRRSKKTLSQSISAKLGE